MDKQYRSNNQGFAKGRATQSRRSIEARMASGETPKTSKALAAMIDKAHGTEYVERYHS